MFSAPIRGLWFVVLVSTLTAELVPLSMAFEAQFSVLTFHLYVAAKLVAFFLFGFLTPLAWWRYQTLGKGILFAISTTMIVEAVQSFIPGHRSSTIELVVKLVLLFGGFACALDLRKYQKFTVGQFSVRFSSPYWEQST
jgi:hypothetical protein